MEDIEITVTVMGTNIWSFHGEPRFDLIVEPVPKTQLGAVITKVEDIRISNKELQKVQKALQSGPFKATVKGRAGADLRGRAYLDERGRLLVERANTHATLNFLPFPEISYED